MKKTLLLAAVTLLSRIALSQNTFNRAYHDQNEVAVPFVAEVMGDIYSVAESRNVYGFGISYLYRHSPAGGLKQKSILGGGTALFGFKTLDNKLLVVGRQGICDVVNPTMNNFITKVDTNGVALFTATYTVPAWSFPTAALQYSDSSYFSFADSILFRHSKNGQFISKTNLGFSYVSAAILLSNNNILLSSKQGTVDCLIEISPSGGIITTKPYATLFRKFAFYGGQKIFGLGFDGNLYKISPTLSLLGLGTFSSGAMANDFVSSNDTIYSIISSSSAPAGVTVSDTSFNVISLTATTTHSITQHALCRAGTKLAIVSTGMKMHTYQGNTYHQFTSLSVINPLSGNNFSSDLALLSIAADSTYIQCSPMVPSGGYYCTAWVRPRIKVKNVGSTVVTKFKLNSLKWRSVACGEFYFQEQFSGLNLQPGDSITLTASSFVNKSLSSVTATTVNETFCFYTTVPNDETDKVTEDNEACTGINFLVTGLKEQKNFSQLVQVIPNPFENNFDINSDTEIKTLRMYNAVGMLVKELTVEAKNVSVQSSELPPGIYILKIETENGTAIKKVLKN